MDRGHTIVVAILLCLLGGADAFAQQNLHTQKRVKSTVQEGNREISGYLIGVEPDFRMIVPPYPQMNSIEDIEDVASLRHWQQSEDSARWQLANSDARMSYDQFAGVFGTPINNATAPILVNLLNRVEEDVQAVAFSAKSYYDRPRPFQRFQMGHVCGANEAPAPEVPLKGGSSYPSGHTSFGWATALILAEIAPDHASYLLARGHEYGESRIVCAVHYPSDVNAGELIATAVVARLHAVPEFQRDLECAREEHKASEKSGSEISRACQLRQTHHEK